jgi:NADPH:quinone reductase-like Zn-dependent oxidoreductase
MRAAVRTGILGWTIAFKEDVPLPGPLNPNVAIAPNDVLIKVKSAAINPVDYKLPNATMSTNKAPKTTTKEVRGKIK